METKSSHSRSASLLRCTKDRKLNKDSEKIPQMNFSEAIFLASLVILAITVLGGGTFYFCFFGHERGLQFFSVTNLRQKIDDLEDSHDEMISKLVETLNARFAKVKECIEKIPKTVVLKDSGTWVDLEMGPYCPCQRSEIGIQVTEVAPVTTLPEMPVVQEFAINIPE